MQHLRSYNQRFLPHALSVVLRKFWKRKSVQISATTHQYVICMRCGSLVCAGEVAVDVLFKLRLLEVAREVHEAHGADRAVVAVHMLLKLHLKHNTKTSGPSPTNMIALRLLLLLGESP